MDVNIIKFSSKFAMTESFLVKVHAICCFTTLNWESCSTRNTYFQLSKITTFVPLLVGEEKISPLGRLKIYLVILICIPKILISPYYFSTVLCNNQIVLLFSHFFVVECCESCKSRRLQIFFKKRYS